MDASVILITVISYGLGFIAGWIERGYRVIRAARGDTPQPDARHKKRGTEYYIVGGAKLQTNKPISDMSDVVVYRCRENGHLWVRSKEEFYDGRFEIYARGEKDDDT